MRNSELFYINGEWVRPHSLERAIVVNPANEEAICSIAMANIEDVDLAVGAATAAFPLFSQTTPTERIELLRTILRVYSQRIDEIAEAITLEVGAPLSLSREAQAACGVAHLETMLSVMGDFQFERQDGRTQILYEPVGVCALITPWNWPINQIACKVLPAIAAGCTMVLKPSELSPINALLWAEVMDEAGVPAGVFNLVNGDGPVAGARLSAHPDIDMVSFTGSTRAGISIAKAAADTVKRVHQELGGKSANILLPGVDLDAAVRDGVHACFINSGQSCNAPTRMLVPHEMHEEAVKIAKAEAEAIVVGDPLDLGTDMGPVISRRQWDTIQKLIEAGIADGADLATGGLGLPEGANKGYYVRPTVFGGVTPDMTVAREEIFGPVLAIMPYSDEEEAIRIANDSVYGLAAYVQAPSAEEAARVARRLRAGSIYLNSAEMDFAAPFGGYKQSGNGREGGVWGLHDFLEIKGITR